MKSEYLPDYIKLLERVFSYGYKEQYAFSFLERSIAYSPFFLAVEKDHDGFPPIIEEHSLMKSVFPEEQIDLTRIPIYTQCLWAAEAYLRIQGNTRLTFEAIFLHLPIKRMYELFGLYHEMDFSQLIDLFEELRKKHTVFELLLRRFNYSLKKVSSMTEIPYDTLYSLKQRRRDIKKINVENAIKLSSLFRVRVETLTELSV